MKDPETLLYVLLGIAVALGVTYAVLDFLNQRKDKDKDEHTK